MHREVRWSKVENKRAQRKGNKQKQSGNNTSDGLEREWSELIAKDTAAVTFVRKAQGLLSHEVSNHGGRGRKRRGDIACLDVLATEVDAHVDMSSSGLIGWMERHSDSALVVTEELGGARLPEAEVSKKEAQVEGLFSALGESIVLCLLSAETYRGAEFHFPAARGAIEQEDVGARGLAVIEVGSPITVRVAVGLGVASGVIGPKDKSKIFCVTEVLGDAMVGKPELLAGVVHVAAKNADGMGEIGARPHSQVDQFAMRRPDFRAQCDIDLCGAVLLAVHDGGVQRRAYSSGGLVVVAHVMNEVAYMPASVNGKEAAFAGSSHMPA